MFRALIPSALFLLIVTVTARSDVIHVPGDYSTIKQAIAAAAPGDTVLVAPGTYVENIDFLGKAITVKSLEGPEETCIDGGNPIDPYKGSVVTFMSGEGQNAILEGFTITNGRGYSFSGAPPYRGGGIYCEYSEPSIQGNIIRGNTVEGDEYNCYGGGIESWRSSPVIDGNIIIENQSLAIAKGYGSGGGISCREGPAVITNNIIEDNTAGGRDIRAGRGGGIFIFASGGQTLISGNIIRNNRSHGEGGGLYCGNSGSKVQNCVFQGNFAYDEGGAIHNMGGNSTNINNTLLENRAKRGGGLYGGAVVLVNTIFWDNQADPAYGPEICVEGIVTVSYSDIQGGQAPIKVFNGSTLNWGVGMIDTDPLLNDPDRGDYHLTGASPCIDAGDSGAPALPGTDFDGNVRLFDGDGDGSAWVDLGADEILAHQVPGTYATIQEAIDAAVEQGVVCVAPGTYEENIDFSGKPVQVTANQGPYLTVIDGRSLGPVVSFQNGEGHDSILEGFCITNGSAMNGGGILCSGASPEIRENVIQENAASQSGGGIYCESGSPAILHNTVASNEAASGGGVACMLVGAPRLDGNYILDNIASVSGGGFYCQDSAPIVVNCLVGYNASPSGGGLFVGPGSLPIFTHDTVYANSAQSMGGGMECGDALVAAANSIFYNNTAPIAPQISGTQALVIYSDVEGGWPGTGNIDAQPNFLDPGAQDFRLQADSPCLDKGHANVLSLPGEDFEGDERIKYSVPDMGMDEYWMGDRTLAVPDRYGTIEEAIYDANDTDTVLVAPGTYYGCTLIEWKAVSLKSESGRENTVLDGEQAGSVVLFRDTGESACTLEGFTIRNGSGSFYDESTYDLYMAGGGVFCKVCSPTIKGNLITANDVNYEGGGLCFIDSLSEVCENEIVGNSSAQNGGGISSGQTYGFEGGIVLRNNLVSGNSAAYYGGGAVLNEDQALDNLIIDNNAALGGGLYCWGSEVVGNRICFNTAAAGGGVKASSGRVCNNLIFGNTADEKGGGLYCANADESYTNNTIVGNSAGNSGGGIFFYSETNEMLNTIVWGNEAPVGASISLYNQGGFYMWLKINYSVVEGGESEIYLGVDTVLFYGRNMVEGDPQFANDENNDFHLLVASPCIDAGSNEALNLPAVDMDGQPRIFAGIRNYVLGQPAPEALVDIGADEYYGKRHHRAGGLSWK